MLTPAVTLAAPDPLPRPAASAPLHLDWATLPAIPDREGFAAPFAGVTGGALLVAGGANFPGKKPWEGGTKVWYDSIFILEQPSAYWAKAGKLPRPLAYGVSVTTSNGVLCIGGSDAQRHYADVFLLEWRGGQIRQRDLPSLPSPCANMSGAIVGNVVYVAGGTAAPDSTNAMRTFWSLDLGSAEPRWQVLETWPGPARMLAVAGSGDGEFYLFSGVDLYPGPDGKPVRNYLRDAFRYKAGRGWKSLLQMPRATVAAPSPAAFANGNLIIVSGDDGALATFEPKSKHPGFPTDVIAYDAGSATWTELGTSPLSRATVPVVQWRGRFVIPNGEARPGVRSPEVWTMMGSETRTP